MWHLLAPSQPRRVSHKVMTIVLTTKKWFAKFAAKKTQSSCLVDRVLLPGDELTCIAYCIMQSQKDHRSLVVVVVRQWLFVRTRPKTHLARHGFHDDQMKKAAADGLEHSPSTSAVCQFGAGPAVWAAGACEDVSSLWCFRPRAAAAASKQEPWFFLGDFLALF